jgi:hypothetical protein
MAVGVGELKMIRCTGMPKHHAIESSVIFESIQDPQAQSIAVKTN